MRQQEPSMPQVRKSRADGVEMNQQTEAIVQILFNEPT
uniref:Uncharacterized protein n=1 Tax=Rhizophora mucronata TaxID=61149 RepID=A0A2P2IRY8_RHIMU